jgi:predicted HAD superfamily hydrolase
MDSTLGLVSLLASRTFISALLRLLKYVTYTVHFTFLSGRLWTAGLKQLLIMSQPLRDSIDQAIAIFLQHTNLYTEFGYGHLFAGYKAVAYLGFSCQIVLTVELAYLSSVNIFLLYKIIAKLYKYSIWLLKYLYGVVSCSRRNILTI